jgi:outer membrane protein assembly factor BamB
LQINVLYPSDLILRVAGASSNIPETQIKTKGSRMRCNVFGFMGAVLLTSSAAALAVTGTNWPQWRGPEQNGVAPGATPPTTWSETNNIKWKTRIPGDGEATPIVWENRVFVQTAIPTGKKSEAKSAEQSDSGAANRGSAPAPQARPEAGGPGGGRRGRGGFGGPKPVESEQFAVICLDRGTGKELWRQVAREEIPHEGYRQNEGSFASNSGLTDGKNFFAYFGSHGLYCYDFDGHLKWSKDLGKMRIAMGFGEGSSPALYKDRLIVNWDNEDGSYITAIDKSTGNTIWKEARDEHTSWSTPLVLEHKGKAQAIVTATGKIRSYDLDSGKVLWECGGLTRNVIPSPVADDETVYCMSGFSGNSLLAIQLGKSGDLTGTDAVRWSHRKGTPYVPSPLLSANRLYFLSGNNGILSCFDTKTGQPFYEAERISDVPGVYASPIAAAGKVYLAGRNGITVVLKDGEKLETLATNRLEEKFDASPVAVGGDLLLRGHEYLYCIAEK